MPSKQAVVAMVGLVVAIVIVGVALFIRSERQATKAREEADRVEAMAEVFRSEIDAVAKNPRADAPTLKAAIARIQVEHEKWKGRSTENDVHKIWGRLETALHADPHGAEYWTAFDAAAELVERAASQSTEKLIATAESLRRLQDETGDDARYQQIGAWRTSLYRTAVEKIQAEVDSFAAASADVHQVLAKYAAADDFVRRRIYDSRKSGLKAYEDDCTAIYKRLVRQSDAYSGRVLTPEFERAIPWKDLLADDLVKRWTNTARMALFPSRIDKGVLIVEPGDRVGPVVPAIFDQKTDDLRHFVLDLEFAVEGAVTMFFHVSPSPLNPDSRQSHTYDLVASTSGLVSGRKYELSARYIGSDLTVEFPKSPEVPAWRAPPSWAKLRTGGIAFVVPPKARFTVTRMRIKDLR